MLKSWRWTDGNFHPAIERLLNAINRRAFWPRFSKSMSFNHLYWDSTFQKRLANGFRPLPR
jgi:hypothetical protein